MHVVHLVQQKWWKASKATPVHYCYRHGGAEVKTLTMLTRGNITAEPRKDPIWKMRTLDPNATSSTKAKWQSTFSRFLQHDGASGASKMASLSAHDTRKLVCWWRRHDEFKEKFEVTLTTTAGSTPWTLFQFCLPNSCFKKFRRRTSSLPTYPNLSRELENQISN